MARVTALSYRLSRGARGIGNCLPSALAAVQDYFGMVRQVWLLFTGSEGLGLVEMVRSSDYFLEGQNLGLV